MGGDLEARARQVRDDLAAGGSVIDWHSTRCNQLYGLVRYEDPLAPIVAAENVVYPDAGAFEERLKGTEISDLGGVTFGTVKFGSDFGGNSASERWVFESDEWFLDNCPTDIGVGVSTDPNTQDDAGLTARLTDVNAAWDDGGTGYYQFLSQQCRLAASEVYGQYLRLALETRTAADSQGVLLDESDIEIFSVEGPIATTEPIFSARWLTAGTATDRWIYEDSNWYYDGCPTEAEEAARTARDIKAIAAAHPSLPLRITGLSRTGATDTLIDGVTQRSYSYQTTISMPWWDAQYLFIQVRTVTALENAGYDVTVEEDGATIEAVRRRDEKARITVVLEPGTGADKEVQVVNITLRYG